jgi:tryptophan-rich sensory protein
MNPTESWYQNLQKPFFAPPPAAFGIAWSILYPIIFASFGYTAYLVYKRKLSNKVLIPLLLNLISNLSFSYIQFVLQNNILALIDILVVLISLVWFIIEVRKSSKILAYIQIPYLLWVSFATILQSSITFLNINERYQVGISLFVLMAGYIIGLGAVTVIDLHGFLARKSSYWTRATITSHKITKPLIWIGTFLVTVGSIGFYTSLGINNISYIHWTILSILIINGSFLSFWLSPRLLQREKEGKAEELLPQNWQNAIFVSFIVSFLGWWSSLILVIYYFI